jgi:L-ascorbate metabolism protein UlaG (beta-lactamase superfamily)
VAVTHEHADHADLATLTFLVERDACPVYTNASFAQQLGGQGIHAKALLPDETVTSAGFKITGVSQQHGELSGGRPIPEDVGFIIDDTFYTTGDSVVLDTMLHAPVLFVPVAGPQMNFNTARRMIEIVKPKLAIPMHYANTKNYPIDMQELQNFMVAGTEILVLGDGQSFTWPR